MADHIIQKTCVNCKELKDISQFIFRVESHTYRRQCRTCINNASARRRKVIPQTSKRKRYLRALYGITVEDYEYLWNEQRGCCALCKKAATPRQKLMVDHCHTSGVIRGLLCAGCNGGLGKLGDNIEGLQNALQYLQNAEVNGFQPTLSKRVLADNPSRRQRRGSELPQSVLNEDKVRMIKAQYEEGYSQSALANKYGVSIATISNIVRGIGWTHVL